MTRDPICGMTMDEATSLRAERARTGDAKACGRVAMRVDALVSRN